MTTWFVAALVLAGCQGANPENQAGVTDSAFTCGVEVAPNREGAGLSAWLSVCSASPTTVAVTIDDGVRQRVQRADGVATDHQILLLGLRPATAHTLTVELRDEAGDIRSRTVTYTSEALPDDMPAFTVTVTDRARVEPGLTLLRLGRYLAMVDVDGDVRWWLAAEDLSHALRISPRNTVMVHYGRHGIVEYALSGAIVAAWYARNGPELPPGGVAVDVEALHHDFDELPDGHWLGLSIERRWVEDYPTSETDPLAPPEDAFVAGDVVVEFTPQGEVRYAVPLLDILDPRRIANDAVRGDFWDPFYDFEDTKDWSHANSIWYDVATDEVVVSLRHQDAVVGLRRAAMQTYAADLAGGTDPLDTDVLAWIVAPDANWRAPWTDALLRAADPEALPVYHQHSAKILADGQLMLFDNGNDRASAFETPVPVTEVGSRGATLALNRQARTWSLTWAYGTDGLLFSGSQGDCDALPTTGNRLVTFGNVADPSLPEVRVVEVAVAGETSEEVWRLEGERPLTTFRAERVTVIEGF